MKKVYLIATFVAIIAGIATYMFSTQLVKSSRIKDAPTTSVVVAIEEIKENTILTMEMFEVRFYTTESVVPNAADKIEDVVGKLSRYPIAKGEQVVRSKLIVYGETVKDAALSYQLLPGEYAYSLSLDSVQGVSGFIARGDYVDVLFTSDTADAAGGTLVYMSEIILRDVYVLRVGNNAANKVADAPNGQPITAYTEVVFKLNEEQIIKLSNYLAAGPVRLALKPVTAGEMTTEMIQ